MNPLRELRSMVSGVTHVESGVVTAVTAASVLVRSRGGLKSFSTSSPEQYKPGDTVRFQGNVLLGRAVSVETLPVFKV